MSNGVVGAAVGAVIAAIVGITVLGGSWYTVDAGYRGVITRNGALVGTAEPGLGFKMPLIDGVRDISVQSQSRSYVDVSSYSKDQQTALLAMTINYRIPADKVEEVYVEYGSEDALLSRLLDPKAYSVTKTVFGKYNAVAAIQERSRLVSDIQNAITDSVNGPIIIESVQLTNIDFDDVYEKAIQDRMTAEVEVQRLQQNAEREKVQAQIVVTQAQAQADAQLAAAKAKAESLTLLGNAEADAIRAKGAALRDNPALVDLTKAERWNGVLPVTMLPNTAVPFIEANK